MHFFVRWIGVLPRYTFIDQKRRDYIKAQFLRDVDTNESAIGTFVCCSERDNFLKPFVRTNEVLGGSARSWQQHLPHITDRANGRTEVMLRAVIVCNDNFCGTSPLPDTELRLSPAHTSRCGLRRVRQLTVCSAKAEML